MHECTDRILHDMPVEFRQICVLAVQESVMLSRAAEKRSTSFKTDPQPGMATLMEVELPSKESTPLQSAQKQPRIEKFQELSHESDQDYSGLLDIGPSDTNKNRLQSRYEPVLEKPRVSDSYKRKKSTKSHVPPSPALQPLTVRSEVRMEKTNDRQTEART